MRRDVVCHAGGVPAGQHQVGDARHWAEARRFAAASAIARRACHRLPRPRADAADARHDHQRIVRSAPDQHSLEARRYMARLTRALDHAAARRAAAEVEQQIDPGATRLKGRTIRWPAAIAAHIRFAWKPLGDGEFCRMAPVSRSCLRNALHGQAPRERVRCGARISGFAEALVFHRRRHDDMVGRRVALSMRLRRRALDSDASATNRAWACRWAG